MSRQHLLQMLQRFGVSWYFYLHVRNLFLGQSTNNKVQISQKVIIAFGNQKSVTKYKCILRSFSTKFSDWIYYKVYMCSVVMAWHSKMRLWLISFNWFQISPHFRLIFERFQNVTSQCHWRTDKYCPKTQIENLKPKKSFDLLWSIHSWLPPYRPII